MEMNIPKITNFFPITLLLVLFISESDDITHHFKHKTCDIIIEIVVFLLLYFLVVHCNIPRKKALFITILLWLGVKYIKYQLID